ncbi:hypothetical protein SUGI_0794870 [Cryptomeria japonica]|nr:hypothetical protein SUGI_0794870 [Cryptomeria japonica]
MAHQQQRQRRGGGGGGGYVGSFASATAPPAHQQSACNTIGCSFSDGAIIMPGWHRQASSHKQQQDKVEQEQQSHLNFPQLLKPRRQLQDIQEQPAHQAHEFQDSFEGVPMQPSTILCEAVPQEYLHKVKMQSLQAEEYLQFAFLDAQRNASQNIHLNNFTLHDVSQLFPQLSMFRKSPGHFLHIETQTNLQDGSRSNFLKSQQTQMTPLVGNNIEKLFDVQNQCQLKNNMPSQFMDSTQSQDLQVYSAVEQDTNIRAPPFNPDIQANLAAKHKVSDRYITEEQSNRLQTGQNIASSSCVQNNASLTIKDSVSGSIFDSDVIYSNSLQSGMTESFPKVRNLALAECHFVPEAGDCDFKNTWFGGNKSLDAYDNTITSFSHCSLPSSDFTQKEVITFGNNLAQGTSQMQNFSDSEQLNQIPFNLVNRNRALQLNHSVQILCQGYGFTNQQLIVLRAQILAFKQLKHGRTIPPDVIGCIGPLPLTEHEDQVFSETVSTGKLKHHKEQVNALNNGTRGQNLVEAKNNPEGLFLDEDARNVTAHKNFYAQIRMHLDRSQIMLNRKNAEKLSVNGGEKKQILGMIFSENGHEKGEISSVQLRTKENVAAVMKPDIPRGNKSDTGGNNFIMLKSSSIAVPGQTENFTGPAFEKHPMNINHVRKYVGPLFDFPQCGKTDDFVPMSTHVYGPFTLGYDIKELLSEEGLHVFEKRRTDKLRKVNCLLEMKRNGWKIRFDFFRKLQIEERMLRLLDVQKQLRDEIDRQQRQIMMMSDRTYCKFVRFCERKRTKLARNVTVSLKANHEKQLKEAFRGRKRFLKTSWINTDARLIRNRGVAKYHERMLKEYSKMKDEDHNERMEALKNNDLDCYREMLEQQTQLSGDARDCYKILSSFLSQTEEYLQKLGAKLIAVKNNQKVGEAIMVSASAASLQGVSEDVDRIATHAQEEEVNRDVSSACGPFRDNISINKYYNLAHIVNEKIMHQPSMLQGGTLHDYQLVGLQWMLSLYNNQLNGILADEMGLGKTVQVMALIAYLMEFKGNYGPHLIIVPNAVIVNWKSELCRWLPSLSCIFYVGTKDQCTKLYAQDVLGMKFNVLVTTYEFIMRDRAKLSKLYWKYIIIDEAHHIKDRESQLSHDLDSFQSQRRLLLTGTPLQNDLQELWSLLNLLLPDVFNNFKVFNDWFSKPFLKDVYSNKRSEDVFLEIEKKVIIIHRLHQILEPFMLRRQVKDVEGQLPPKVSVVLRCKISALQAAIYDWVKSTGTLRLDPESETRRVAGNKKRQVRVYAPLKNKCIELRKVCNHPFLSYDFYGKYTNDYLVRTCGKLWVLDRVLIKLHSAGHRVLLFSTMTKLLDILEEYLQWRDLKYRRIDGSTSLEDRETAIVDFNKTGSECFIFLLSICAAGRSLNLQSADTVIIYDPDANPQNEQQAVARAHRIGQKKDVKVIYMESVVDIVTSSYVEDELRSGNMLDVEHELAGKARYMGSVESLIRSSIQQHKMDMADEVINAGCFDQRTTQEERRMTLEALLHNEERCQAIVHDVPSMQEVNRLIARSEEEVHMFDEMDKEWDWPGEMMKHCDIPTWLRVGSAEINAAVDVMSKKVFTGVPMEIIGTKEEEERVPAMSLQTFHIKGVPNLKNSFYSKTKKSSCTKLQLPDKDINGRYIKDECQEYFKTSAEEKNALFVDNEEKKPVDYLDKEEPSEEAVFKETHIKCVDKEIQRQKFVPIKCSSSAANDKGLHFGEDLKDGEDTLSELSSQYEKLNKGYVSCRPASSQKFISLAAFEVKPVTHQLKVYEKADDGERAILPTKNKRKRGGSHCRRWSAVKLRPYFYEKFNYNLSWRSIHCGLHTVLKQKENSIREPFNNGSGECGVHPMGRQLFTCEDKLLEGHTVFHSHCVDKSHEFNGPSELAESASCAGETLMCVNAQKCKNVLSKLLCAVIKDARQRAASFLEFSEWDKNPGYSRVITNPIIAQMIMQRLDRYEYASVLDFVADVRLMLENAIWYHNDSEEAGARRLQELFFQQMAHTFPYLNISSIKSQFSYVHAHSSPLSAQFQENQKEIMSENRMESKAGEAGEVPSTTELVTGKMKQKQIGKEENKARIVPKVPDTSKMLVGLSFDYPSQVSYSKKRQISKLESLCEFRWPAHLKKPRTGIGHRRHSFQ